uniref:SfiI-subtelomeric related protein family member n=1 Tax=Theileria annulata TaxID=5874 RepID=A0A3B0NFL6_THEAN
MIKLLLVLITLRSVICGVFDFGSDKCLNTFTDRVKVGDTFVNTYRPKNVKKIVMSESKSITLSVTHQLTLLMLVLKDNEVRQAQITCSDSTRNHELFDMFYLQQEGKWEPVSSQIFDSNFIQLAQNVKKFDLLKLEEGWYKCSGVDSEILCQIEDNYLVESVVIGDSVLWLNDNNLEVFAIAIALKTGQKSNKLMCKIYFTSQKSSNIVEIEKQINDSNSNTINYILSKLPTKSEETEVTLPTKSEETEVTLPTKSEETEVTLPTKSEETEVTLPTKSEETEVTLPTKSEETEVREPVSSPTTLAQAKDGIKLASKLIDIRLDCDEDSVDPTHTVNGYISLGLNTIKYEPRPGVKVLCLRDGNARIWESYGEDKILKSATFYNFENSNIFLEINYTLKCKKCFGCTTSSDKVKYYMKDGTWFTLTDNEFFTQISELKDIATQNTSLSGVNKSASFAAKLLSTLPVGENESDNRLRNINLIFENQEQNQYNISGYLMDGLETSFYEPKPNCLVKELMDKGVRIWDNDKGKKVFKHAKFSYKGNSHIYLEVLYSDIGEQGTKPSNKTDYFIKRAKWFSSPQDDFYRELDALIDKVTMRNVIVHEKMTFDEHIQKLKFHRQRKNDKNWLIRIFKREPEVVITDESTPIECNIFEVDKEKFTIEVNNKEAFGIYTPKIGFALTRLFDEDRLIWYQEKDGLGCTTFYIDLSGENPLLHLLVDDPLDSHKYYKKHENNWHIIDEKEYEEIRKSPKGKVSQSDFHRIS